MSLSDKRGGSGKYWFYKEESVKQFIKELKEEFKGTSYHDFMIFLDELAGEALI